MMRALLIASLVLACSAAVPGASQSAQAKKDPKTMTLAGCALPDEKAPDQVMFTDTKTHETYRLTGRNVREYLRTPIQIDGGVVVKGIKITGGLLPNANVAAQAGAIDPSRAAVAGASSTGPSSSTDDPQEFRVKAIRRGSGTCEP